MLNGMIPASHAWQKATPHSSYKLSKECCFTTLGVSLQHQLLSGLLLLQSSKFDHSAAITGIWIQTLGWFNYFSKIFHFCFFCTQKQQQTAQEQLFFCIIWHRVFDKTEVCDSDRIIAQEIYSRIFSNSCIWNHRSLSSSIMPFLPIGVMILSGFYFLKDASKSLAHFKNIITNKKKLSLINNPYFIFPTYLSLFLNLPVKGNYSIVTRCYVTSFLFLPFLKSAQTHNFKNQV